jgi:hypothetical protein
VPVRVITGRFEDYMEIYACDICGKSSTNSYYAGKKKRCKCGIGWMNKVSKEFFSESEIKRMLPKEIVNCISCGRDTTSPSRLCKRCK